LVDGPDLKKSLARKQYIRERSPGIDKGVGWDLLQDWIMRYKIREGTGNGKNDLEPRESSHGSMAEFVHRNHRKF
jgi:hypothetical protein